MSENAGAIPTYGVYALRVDWLLFENYKREPDDDLKLQFEAVQQFDEEERKTALDGLILNNSQTDGTAYSKPSRYKYNRESGTRS